MKIDLQTALKAPQKISIDFETPSLMWWKERALLMGIYAPTFNGYIDLEEYNDVTLSSFFKDFVKSRSFIFHNCVPTDCKVLTKKGWKTYKDIKIGDFVLGYNDKTSKCEWTKITRIFQPEPMPIITFGTSRDTFRASFNHRWVGTKLNHHTRKYRPAVFTTKEFTECASFNLILSAPSDIEGNLDITPDEAAIIAWIITDGCIQWKGKNNNSPYTYISQSKEPFVEVIKDLVKDYTTSVYKQMPKNKNQKIVFRFNLKAPMIRNLFEKAGIARDLSNLDEFILNLSLEARKSFFEASYMAEGYQKKGIKRIAQKKSLIKTDTLQLVSFLMGYYSTKRLNNIALKRPVMSGQHIKITKVEELPAWCVQTELGSWVANDGHSMFITGNSKFDFHHMEKWVDVQPITFSDTLILAYMNKENEPHRLEQLASKYIGPSACVKKMAVDEFLKKNCRGKKKDFTPVPKEMLGARAVEDAENTYKLFDLFRPKVYNKEIYRLEVNLVKILLKMEDRGILVDKKYLQELDAELLAEIKKYRDKYSNVNLNSTKQLAEWLFNTLKLRPSLYTNRGAPSTRTEALKRIDAQEVKDLLAFRKIDKLQSAFTANLIDRIDEGGRIHANFKQTGTETGRLSCTEPNLQQVPAKSPVIRKAFLGNKSLWTFDYSQMEAVLYAVYNNEKDLLSAIDKNIDVYRAMASKIYDKAYTQITDEERKKTKTIFLGLMYGMGKDKFERSTDTTFEKVQGYFNKKSLQRKLNEKVKVDGYVETMFGRRRHLQPEEAYKAINTIIQGSSADIMKMSMVAFPPEIQNKMRLTVHDELVFEDLTKKEAKEISKIMTSFDSHLKVGVGTGKNWWDCKTTDMKLEELEEDD